MEAGGTRASGNDGTGLRSARQARGLSQQQLAELAGVSRHFVSAVESGTSGPSLRVALALAGALGLSVEEVFGSTAPVPLVSAWPVAPVGEAGSRVALAPIGGTFVALPLTGMAAYRAGFAAASGLTVGASADWPEPADAQPHDSSKAGPPSMRSVRPIGPQGPTVVVAGDDPALPLLAVPLGLLDPPLGFAWWPCGGGQALELAAEGLVHAGAVCLRGGFRRRRLRPWG